MPITGGTRTCHDNNPLQCHQLQQTWYYDPLGFHWIKARACITTAIWHHRKPVNQWQRSFLMKSALSFANRFATMPAHSSNTGPSPYPESKVHGANMGHTWGRQDPVGPTLASWTLLSGFACYVSQLYVWHASAGCEDRRHGKAHFWLPVSTDGENKATGTARDLLATTSRMTGWLGTAMAANRLTFSGNTNTLPAMRRCRARHLLVIVTWNDFVMTT